jgi:uncharacterized protein
LAKLLEEARMRVVVAGGTGLIGRALAPELAARGYDITVLTRSPAKRVEAAAPVRWDGLNVDERELAGAHAVVNLSGESLGGRRWTAGRKRRILSSRVDSTAGLVAAIARLGADERPRVYVSASGIGYLGDRGDEELDEDAAPGDTFLSQVSVAWETAALAAEQLGLRVVLMRTALAIDRQAPAFRTLVLPFRLFAGGRLGSGRQWLPWIHLHDLVRLYVCAIDDDALQGPVHAVAPEAARQKDVARAVGATLHRPAVLPTPAWALRLALGDQAQLILDSQHAISRKLRAEAFLFPRLSDALTDALG